MQTDLNPFVYSRPIAPDDVVDRDDETRKLLALAAGGHYVRLYAPRKYGKTSLLRRVLRDAERDEGMVPVLVDLYGVLSLADVAVRVERAYAGLRGADGFALPRRSTLFRTFRRIRSGRTNRQYTGAMIAAATTRPTSIAASGRWLSAIRTPARASASGMPESSGAAKTRLK